jgi:hypothetical protein
MDELPLTQALLVLDIFRDEKEADLWVNRIVELVNAKTGSGDRQGNNKPAIIKGIEYLEQASIIESHLVNKQKTIKNLTPLGREVINFMDDFDSCSNNYAKLKNLIVRYNFEVGSVESQKSAENRNIILKRKLLTQGFNKDDIKFFDDIMNSAFVLETMYRKNILNCLLHRYSHILTKHRLNERGNRIVLSLMTKAILKIFSVSKDLQKVNSDFFEKPNRYFSSEYEFIDRLPFMDIYQWILIDIDSFYLDSAVLINNEMSNVTNDLILSMLLLLRPHTNDITEFFSEFDKKILKLKEDEILSAIRKAQYLGEIDSKVTNLSTIKRVKVYRRYLQLAHDS